jgi:hypothetical protein
VSPRFLHVANGTSTTGTIAAAGIPGALSIWADPLNDGPVPGGLSDDELVDVRARFLSGPEHTHQEVSEELRRWRAVIVDGQYDEVVLWFEHDLFDQLNLIQLLSWTHDGARLTKPVTIVCVGSFPGRPNFKGLGELTPEELAPLLDTRQPVTAAQYALAARAWEAYRAPAPDALVAVIGTDTSALPFLAPALERFLAEYPWTSDGLSAFERRFLQMIDRSALSLASAFPRMQDGERSYYMTGESLEDLALSLSSTSPPLVTLDRPSSTSPGRLLQGSASLTDAGRDVLAGRRDRIELCGIDRWLGGVHLTTGGAIWRWDPSGRRLVGGGNQKRGPQ